MKRFLLAGLIAAILSNVACAMQKDSNTKALYFSHIASGGTTAVNSHGRVVPHNRIEIVRNPLNPESLFLALLGATGLISSVYEGSFTGCAFSAFTMVTAAMEFKKHSVRIKRYNDKTLVGDISITGDPVVLEKAVAQEQAQVDELNKEPKIKRAPFRDDVHGASNIAAQIIAEQEADGLMQ